MLVGRHRAVHRRLAGWAGSRQSAAWLLGARAVQGVGAAIAAPSTLALLTDDASARARERTRAIAYYSAVAGGGGSVGLVLGGVLTDLALVALGPVHQRADRPRA